MRDPRSDPDKVPFEEIKRNTFAARNIALTIIHGLISIAAVVVPHTTDFSKDSSITVALAAFVLIVGFISFGAFGFSIVHMISVASRSYTRSKR